MLLNYYSMIWGGSTDFVDNPSRTSCSRLRNGPQFDNIDPGEIDVFTIEFTEDLLSGRVAVNPTFNCYTINTDPGATVDSSPSSRLIGLSNISYRSFAISGAPRTFVNQRIGNMVAGNLYSLVATLKTSDNSVLQRYAKVYCKSPTS